MYLKEFLGNIANVYYIGGNDKNLNLVIKNMKINIDNSAGIYIISNPINPELKKIGFSSLSRILKRLNEYGTYFPRGVNIEGLIILDSKNQLIGTEKEVEYFEKAVKGDKTAESKLPKYMMDAYRQLKNKKESSDIVDNLLYPEMKRNLYINTLTRCLEIQLHYLLKDYKLNIDGNEFSTKSQIKNANPRITAFGEYFKININELLSELKKWNIPREFVHANILIFFEQPFFYGEYIEKPIKKNYKIYSNILLDLNRYEISSLVSVNEIIIS
jgi:hypothetical protein